MIEASPAGAAEPPMPSEIYDKTTAAAEFIRTKTSAVPKIALILGSGLGVFAHHIKNAAVFEYAEIPHFPQTTVVGHNGRLVIGALSGTTIAVMQGRVHFYEGYSATDVVFPIRVLKQIGVETLIVTNACGGIRDGLHRGDLVLISDHINLTGTNPLIGLNESRFGERFFDMTEAYSMRLRELAHATAEKQGFSMPEGVYLSVSGPSFETPAEIRAFRAMGADLVGMSTVHEVIVARHMGIEVLGISCVTNLAAGIQGRPLDHYDVIETGLHVQQRFAEFLTAYIGVAAG
jgi:purine-nucleoside phosphorylase